MRMSIPLACVLFLVPLSSALAADQSSSSFAELQKPYFALLKVEEAWKITRGGTDCKVGVIDTGFDFFHPALEANLKPGWFAPGVYHTDFFSMDGHGTEVSSLIAARRKDGEDGMWGMAPDCAMVTASMGMPMHKLIQLQQQFFARNPKATMADLQKEMAAHTAELQTFGNAWLDWISETMDASIRYLADQGVRVINFSGGVATGGKSKPEFKTRMETAFDYAKQKDVLIVLGAGNNNQRVTDYPGDRTFVLIAGASTLADQRWTMTVKMKEMEIKQGSDYGPRLSVVAPIENIVVAAPHEEAYYNWKDTPMGEQKAEFEGLYSVRPWGATSCAAPQVAALAALVRTIRPDLKAAEVIRLIEQGADAIGSPGFHEETGYGRINYLRTLELARDVF
ncbi:MAG: S8 family peptidase [Terriglobia bacterium]